jgi:hypothetical protein
MEKFFKYKMVNNNKCIRCGDIETHRHLLQECRESRKVWKAYIELLGMIEHPNEVVGKYDDVFTILET